MKIWDYIIAEMSANHGGDIDRAKEIVQMAKKAGADCLKIQTYTADTLTIDCRNQYFEIHNGLWDKQYLYDLYEKAATPWEWQEELKTECENLGMDFLSTPFDKTAVDFLEQLGVDAYKIASFEIVDIPLISYVASKGKTMILSCGMASKEEIKEAIEACWNQNNRKIILMKCCSEYPANLSNMNLVTISDMLEFFKIPVGLSDHSMGTLASIVGCSMGAVAIEKHFCLSREFKTEDSAFSLTPDEFEELVSSIRTVEKIKGNVLYGATENEENSMVFRRSIFAIKDIEIGECFTEDNIRIIRPGYGLKPKYYTQLLGKRAGRTISKGEPILYKDMR